ncbi:peptidase inhibitor family I36 protein [Streptomyces sp. NPDC002722]|uniref:peptidase inhibitor family I36 protein n=1 Tax=unclassified Streptomyces TaxID=2593676 RepID=UPI00332AD944
MTASPAVADSDQCPYGSFCVWEKSSYRGDFRHYTSSTPNVGDYTNDRMTSYWNRTGKKVGVHRNDCRHVGLNHRTRTHRNGRVTEWDRHSPMRWARPCPTPTRTDHSIGGARNSVPVGQAAPIGGCDPAC